MLLAKLITQVTKLTKGVKKMANTLQDLKDAIQEVSTAVDADVEQTTKVVEAVNALIKKIEETGSTDFEAEVTALKTATSKLASDNAAVQEAIDKAVPPVA
jgi:predicted  nucleic acid-binding Zn-ribbon protein